MKKKLRDFAATVQARLEACKPTGTGPSFEVANTAETILSEIKYVVTTGIPQLGKDGGEKFIDELARVRAEVAAVRRFGSAALDLAWVAAGRFDGFWERGLQLWDIAAGFVLMQEAGGMVTGLDKKDPTRGSFVAANTSLAPKITELVEGRLKKPAAGSKLLKPL